MNNNLTFSYNDKVYKTEAAMKKAKTMDAKQAIKQTKREAYAASEKAFKRQQTDFSKQLLNIGSIYDEEKKKEIKINKQEKVRERKKYEPGEALGTFKIVTFYDNLHYEMIVTAIDPITKEKIYYKIVVPNIPVIKQNIESELRKQITANNSKHKLSCFITIKYLMQTGEVVDINDEGNIKSKIIIEPRYFNSYVINLTSTHVISGFINDVIISFEKELEDAKKGSGLKFVGIEKLSIKTAKSKAMVGGSYIELPEYIKNKRACVNIKNDDEKCFKWSILASKHYHEMKSGCNDKAYSYFKSLKNLTTGR